MAREVFSWPGVPTLTDENDAGQAYDMGVAFTVPGSVPCGGLRWRVPDAVSAPPGGSHLARLYADGIRIKSQAFTPVAGGDQDIEWAGGDITLTAGVAYIASVWTVHYTYRAGAGAFPISTPTALGSATGSRLTAASDPASTLPDIAGTSIFFVSPLFGEAAEAPLTLTGTLTLPALTLTGELSVSNPPGSEHAHGFPLRSELAEALTEVSGIHGFTRKPGAPKVGDAWPRIGRLAHVAPGTWETAWQIVIKLPQDEGTQDAWIIERLDTLADVLAPLVWILDVEVGASEGAPALLINCRE